MVYAALAGKRRLFKRATQNLPLLIFVFAKGADRPQYSVSSRQWQDFQNLSSWGHMHIFVSEYDTARDQLRQPRESIADLLVECKRLFETKFHQREPVETGMYPKMFALLDRAGFDNKVQILLRHQDGSSTAYQIINGKPSSFAKSI